MGGGARLRIPAEDFKDVGNGGASAGEGTRSPRGEPTGRLRGGGREGSGRSGRGSANSLSRAPASSGKIALYHTSYAPRTPAAAAAQLMNRHLRRRINSAVLRTRLALCSCTHFTWLTTEACLVSPRLGSARLPFP